MMQNLSSKDIHKIALWASFYTTILLAVVGCAFYFGFDSSMISKLAHTSEASGKSAARTEEHSAHKAEPEASHTASHEPASEKPHENEVVDHTANAHKAEHVTEAKVEKETHVAEDHSTEEHKPLAKPSTKPITKVSAKPATKKPHEKAHAEKAEHVEAAAHHEKAHVTQATHDETAHAAKAETKTENHAPAHASEKSPTDALGNLESQLHATKLSLKIGRDETRDDAQEEHGAKEEEKPAHQPIVKTATKSKTERTPAVSAPHAPAKVEQLAAPAHTEHKAEHKAEKPAPHIPQHSDLDE